jgi:hypothetical protein
MDADALELLENFRVPTLQTDTGRKVGVASLWV